MEIKINNLARGYKLSRKEKNIFFTVAKKVLKGENKEKKTISLAFVDRVEIKELNKKFRKIDKATDVLSFELRPEISAENFLGDYLGEVILCPAVVKEKKENILRVFIHGILHLCGYDHEKGEEDAKIMEKKENLYLSNLKNIK